MRRLLAALALALAPGLAHAQGTTLNCTGTNSSLSPLGVAQLTVSSSALALPTVPSGAVVAVIAVEGSGVRYRDDGTAPTITIGMPLDPGAVIAVCLRSLFRVQFIRSGGTDGNLTVSYYGP